MKVKIKDGNDREYIVKHNDKESIFAIAANSLNRHVNVEYIERKKAFKTRNATRQMICDRDYWSDFYGSFSFLCGYRSYHRKQGGKVFDAEVSAYKNALILLADLDECEKETKYAEIASMEEIRKPVLEKEFSANNEPEQIAYVQKLKKRLEEF